MNKKAGLTRYVLDLDGKHSPDIAATSAEAMRLAYRAVRHGGAAVATVIRKTIEWESGQRVHRFQPLVRVTSAKEDEA